MRLVHGPKVTIELSWHFLWKLMDHWVQLRSITPVDVCYNHEVLLFFFFPIIFISFLLSNSCLWFTKSGKLLLTLQVCAYKDGEVIIDTAAGTLGRYDPRPVQPDSLFPVFSVSKGITAGMVHWLVDKGYATSFNVYTVHQHADV